MLITNSISPGNNITDSLDRFIKEMEITFSVVMSSVTHSQRVSLTVPVKIPKSPSGMFSDTFKLKMRTCSQGTHISSLFTSTILFVFRITSIRLFSK